MQREIEPSEQKFSPSNHLTLGETDVSCCEPFDPSFNRKAHFALQNV